MSVVRHTRTVPTGLKDRVIPTYDVYTHLSDRVLLTRHGSPSFIITGLIADKQVTTAKGSPSFVTTTLVADKAVTTAKGSPSFVTDALVAGKTVSRGKLTYLMQTGSGKPGYVTFPTAYSEVPGVTVTPIYDVTAVGYIPEIDKVLKGCFHMTGSPGGYAHYISIGSA
ncbi:MAG: hypothetical protein QMD10_11415 [Desulfitobacteriaceae bacterium]|nr:hypothetical protein [Desulfitobacteriaceae bacterium]